MALMSPAAGYRTVDRTGLEALVVEHAPLVRRIAHHLSGRLPACIRIEDLVQSGMIGLIEAVRNFDAARGASLVTYASIRIRGAMLDEVRRNDWVPRSVARRSRRLVETIKRLEREAGRAASDEEIAKAMDLSLEDYFSLLQEAQGHRFVDIDELDEDSIAEEARDRRSADPVARLESEQLTSQLAAAIHALPRREALILSLYYTEEMNLREIGEILGIGESRVCQIHGQALLRLRARIETELGQSAPAGR
jgi:RNA polymerase sigma factor for flagellar operon FliA